jgi:CRP-like cAMP-binding protein
VPLFAQCTRNELREIAKLGTRLQIEQGAELTKEGAPGHEFFLLVEGEADCDVHRSTVAVLGPGDFFGELSLIDGGPRTATITAVTPLTVTVLSAGEFRGLLRAAPSISLKLLTNLSGRLRDAQASAIY